MREIPVNEFFETIQGEATFTGTPSLFLRLQKCPVGCSFCDTKYTWYVNDYDETKDINDIINKKNLDFTKGEGNSKHIKLTNHEIFDLCKQSKMNHIVFTGGEPCIYDLSHLTWLLNKNSNNRFTTQIETSGTFEILCDNHTWVTVSPKIGMKGGYEIVEQAMFRANEIKFPVGKLKDIDKLKDLLQTWNIPKRVKIWLQPLSISTKATQLCIEQAMLNNWNISIQTHKYINAR